MQGFGVGALIAGYCAWYTLYQKTWGDGSGFLYNLTGSTRFGGPRAASGSSSSSSTSSSSGSNTPSPTNHGPPGVPLGK